MIVFIFAVLVLRLGYLQIAQGSHYKQIIKNDENITVNEVVPEGRYFRQKWESFS